MNAYETSAQVGGDGRVSITGVPFAPGSEVDVIVAPKRKSAEEFLAAWTKVCTELRASAAIQDMTDEQLAREIADHREGR